MGCPERGADYPPMSEAKIKRRAHAAILEKHSWCIYCGGASRADTIEHMPPISMFNGRQRPKGLEFPTCRECNNGTSLSDTVASLLARAYPDAPKADDLKRLLGGCVTTSPACSKKCTCGPVLTNCE
jgi:hypothetical protein